MGGSAHAHQRFRSLVIDRRGATPIDAAELYIKINNDVPPCPLLIAQSLHLSREKTPYLRLLVQRCLWLELQRKTNDSYVPMQVVR